MYKGYNSMMHRGKEMSRPGKAIPTGQKKMNWTAPVGGQAAGTDSPGKARMRHTMKNKFNGTRHVPGRLKIPRTKGGFYPLHNESY